MGGAVVWTRGSENTKIAKSRQDLKEGGERKRRGEDRWYPFEIKESKKKK